MNTKIISTYGLTFELHDLVDTILSLKDTRLIVFCPQEHTPVSTSSIPVISQQMCTEMCERTRTHMTNNGVTSELVVGRSHMPEVPDIKFKDAQPVRWSRIFPLLFTKIHYLNDWWFKQSTCIYAGTHQGKYQFPLEYDTLDHLCCQRSSLPHYHRALMMDKLAKYNLINPTFSWRHRSNTHNNHFDFQHWQEELMCVNEIPIREDVEDHSIYTVMHQGTMNSLIEVVAESTTSCVFWTEKTTKWLLYGKAFIILGSPEINIQLRSLGFQLYDELFDYEFDYDTDLHNRAEAIASQLALLDQKYNTPELRKQLLGQIMPKIIHNYNQLLAIVNQDYPEELNPALDTIEFRESLAWVREVIKPVQQ